MTTYFEQNLKIVMMMRYHIYVCYKSSFVVHNQRSRYFLGVQGNQLYIFDLVLDYCTSCNTDCSVGYIMVHPLLDRHCTWNNGLSGGQRCKKY